MSGPLAEASGNDSKQLQRFKTLGLSDLKPMQNSGVYGASAIYIPPLRGEENRADNWSKTNRAKSIERILTFYTNLCLPGLHHDPGKARTSMSLPYSKRVSHRPSARRFRRHDRRQPTRDRN